jgi:hypothetical protein
MLAPLKVFQKNACFLSNASWSYSFVVLGDNHAVSIRHDTDHLHESMFVNKNDTVGCALCLLVHDNWKAEREVIFRKRRRSGHLTAWVESKVPCPHKFRADAKADIVPRGEWTSMSRYFDLNSGAEQQRRLSDIP